MKSDFVRNPEDRFWYDEAQILHNKQGPNTEPPETIGASIKMNEQQQDVRLKVRMDSSLSHWVQA